MAEKKSKSNIVHVSGKRKRATARVTLKAGKGIVKINNFLLDHYKPEVAKMRILEPIYLAGEIAKKVDININVNNINLNDENSTIQSTFIEEKTFDITTSSKKKHHRIKYYNNDNKKITGTSKTEIIDRITSKESGFA